MSRLLVLPSIFVLASVTLWLLIWSAPEWTDQNAITSWHYDEDFGNFTVLAGSIQIYAQDHLEYIIMLFSVVYVYKQTFAIPGSFLMNLIAGALFNFWFAFLMVCVLTTIGSTLCYLLSEFFARECVFYYFGERISYLQQKIDDNSNRLLAFMLFIRIFPISPCWLLNIIAPFLNIPISVFAVSSFIGLAPYNFLCVQAGAMISELRSWDDILNTGTFLKLSFFALLPLFYALCLKFPRKPEVISVIKHDRSKITLI